MSTTNELIIQALAPGVALTSVIFYTTGLQNRFLYIASRARELNKEARELASHDIERHHDRLVSVRRQVDALVGRMELIRRTILISYGALFCFILTILQLLVAGVVPGAWATVTPAVTFGLGFLALGAATLSSSGEMLLSIRTLREDVQTSFPGGPPVPGGAPSPLEAVR